MLHHEVLNHAHNGGLVLIVIILFIVAAVRS